jgi:AcrR family transcriptional regulator
MLPSVSVTARRVRYREQRESTRRQILDNAADFLRERPFRELSVDGLMSEIGLTRTAFYRHFDDTTDLVLRLVAELTAKLYPVAERWRANVGKRYPEPAREALGAIVDFYVAEGPLIRAVVDAAGVDERIEAAYRSIMAAFIDLTAETLDALAAAGVVEVVDPPALALALNLMNEAYLLEEFGREPFGDPEVARATLERVWLGAVGLRLAT